MIWFQLHQEAMAATAAVPEAHQRITPSQFKNRLNTKLSSKLNRVIINPTKADFRIVAVASKNSTNAKSFPKPIADFE